ncbi:MAG: hypothetical protein EAS51_11195 [Microbacteriaceae bacterium]|nr:MAG: hypothetical protein EAS51_11195 [Microbacteriaceae bacterium]
MSTWGEPPHVPRDPAVAPSPSAAPGPSYAAAALYAQVPVYDPQAAPAPRIRIRASTFVLAGVLLIAVLVLVGLSGPLLNPLVAPDSPRIFADPAGEFSVKTENLGNSSGTDVEAAVDAITGGISALVVSDDVCGDDVIACVYEGRSTIYVPPRYARMSDAELRREVGTSWDDVIRHEFMHVLQGKLGRAHSSSEQLRALFGEPPAGAERYPGEVDWPVEREADCMAEARYPGYVHQYPGRCSEAQLAFARETLRTVSRQG